MIKFDAIARKEIGDVVVAITPESVIDSSRENYVDRVEAAVRRFLDRYFDDDNFTIYELRKEGLL